MLRNVAQNNGGGAGVRAQVVAPEVPLVLQRQPGIVLPLNEPIPPLKQVQTLIENMKKATEQTIPHQNQQEVLQAINSWETMFTRDYRIDSPVDTDRIAAAHALLFFRLSYVEFLFIGFAQTPQEKVKWVIFSNEIKKIVASILPQGTDLEAFIADDTKKQLEVKSRIKVAQILKEVMPLIMADFARIEEQLYARVDQVNHDRQQQFIVVRNALEQLNNQRGVAIGELHTEFDALTTRVTSIYSELERQLLEAKENGQKIAMKEAAQAQALGELEALINKM